MWTELLTILLTLIQSHFGFVSVPETNISTASFSTSTAIVTHIVDGDTIDVQIGTSTKSVRVRYIGINTPEPHGKDNSTAQCGSYEATAANRVLVDGKTVTLVTDRDPYDPYDRLLAYVYVDGVFVNEELVVQGYATTLSIKPNTRYRSLFEQSRNEAKTKRLGNWQTCPLWQ